MSDRHQSNTSPRRICAAYFNPRLNLAAINQQQTRRGLAPIWVLVRWRGARPPASKLVKDCHCRLDPSLGQPPTAPSLPASVLNHPGGHRQLLRPQEFRIEQLRLVPRATIAQDRHHRVARTQRLRHTHRRGDVDAGGRADRQPLMDQYVEDLLQRFGIGDAFGVVDRRAVQILRYPRLADALGDRAAAASSGRCS